MKTNLEHRVVKLEDQLTQQQIREIEKQIANMTPAERQQELDRLLDKMCPGLTWAQIEDKKAFVDELKRQRRKH